MAGDGVSLNFLNLSTSDEQLPMPTTVFARLVVGVDHALLLLRTISKLWFSSQM